MFRLEAGGNYRIQFACGDSIIFWATIVRGYEGVWLLKNYPSDIPSLVDSISSSEIESRRGLSSHKKMKSWSRWFIKSLCNESNKLLYEGLWILKPYTPVKRDQWKYRSLTSFQKHENSSIDDVKKALDEDELTWVDWWSCGSGAVIGTGLVDKYCGRVKWWRKKVKENMLPPIFVWYINCLDAHIILDGMMASYLEGVSPDIFVLFSGNEEDVELDKDVQNRIVDSLTSRQGKNVRAIPVERVNEIIMQAYDNRPYISKVTKSWATIDSDEVWLCQVSTKLRSIGKSECIQDLEEREG